jgi:hypothetical protein
MCRAPGRVKQSALLVANQYPESVECTRILSKKEDLVVADDSLHPLKQIQT